MSYFRFEGLEIWEIAIDVGNKLFDIADEAELKRKLSKLVNDK